MNLRQMEVFRAVMIAGGVNSAAELLHVSPPAISKTLAQASRGAGLVLFEHVKGRLVATPEAHALYAEIDSLWHGVEKVRDFARELAHPTAGALRLVVSASLAPGVVSRAMTLMYERFPRLQCRVRVVAPDLVSAAIVDQSYDLGVALLPHEHPSIENVKDYRCGLACVMCEDDRLASKKMVRPSDLAGERVISSPESTPFGQALRRAFGAAASQMHCDIEVASSTTACWFAQAGTGIAVVDRVAIAGGVLPGLAVRPFLSSERLSVKIMRSRSRPMSVAQRIFVELFDQVWSELGLERR